ncbi:hypothetical protein JVU11DRAFT_3986 [Chiua virens]|nr:hypothetical protein JVU11DRAFT_3986 [Chiua virens]
MGHYPDDADCQWPLLRLRVLDTSILHKHLRLAVLDAYAETQFGRDIAPTGSDTPRIRLKEMPVSKLHATVFWDKGREEWAVVDMGSKHGTFIQPGDGEPVRLSPPRMASIPRPLHHLDRLIIGSTTFLSHIHEDRAPCSECTSSGEDVIPLFAVPRESYRAAEKRALETAHPEEERNAKKALTSLKRTLLARHDAPLTSTQPPSYIDRSARRRALHPTSQFDSPGVEGSRSSSPGPVKEENIGRRLLMKQGWQPGTSLGIGSEPGLVAPIEAHAMVHRAGIGMKGPLSLQERYYSNDSFN